MGRDRVDTHGRGATAQRLGAEVVEHKAVEILETGQCILRCQKLALEISRPFVAEGSSVSALVPSPGGFGALDVALVAGLVAVGTPSATALATVLAYRLLTVWLPLVPGACVLAVLLRRRVI